MQQTQTQLITIKAAAKQIGCAVSHIRRMIRNHELTAYPVGGGERLPRLRVMADDVVAAIRANPYVPDGEPTRRRPRRSSRRLDPAAAAM